MPGFEVIDPQTGLPELDEAGRLPVFFEVKHLAFGAVAASMIAYLLAQLCDVRLFHFWKSLTKGKHLWLRNNLSTVVSQLVDTTAIMTVLYFANNLGSSIQSISDLVGLIFASYIFKVLVALFDTPLFYLGVWALKDKVSTELK